MIIMEGVGYEPLLNRREISQGAEYLTSSYYYNDAWIAYLVIIVFHNVFHGCCVILMVFFNAR